jgi:hypothetical protein
MVTYVFISAAAAKGSEIKGSDGSLPFLFLLTQSASFFLTEFARHVGILRKNGHANRSKGYADVQDEPHHHIHFQNKWRSENVSAVRPA